MSDDGWTWDELPFARAGLLLEYRELKQQRDALRAEVERLTRERAQVETVLSHELSKALAEVERLKANAERYQWMKRVHADGDESVTAWIGYYPADQWDAEIDKHRADNEGEQRNG